MEVGVSIRASCTTRKTAYDVAKVICASVPDVAFQAGMCKALHLRAVSKDVNAAFASR